MRLRARMPGRPVFRRQHPIGPFIADFFCAAAKLVVEVDGHLHGYDEQAAYDARRDDYLQHRGYGVIRIWASEIMADADAVADWVIAEAKAGGQDK